MTMCRVAVLAALALALGACATVRPPRDPSALRYNVTYRHGDDDALDVEVVLVEGTPRDFLFSQAGGVQKVWAYRDNGEVRSLSVRDGAVRLPPRTRFLRYRYALDALIREHGPDFFSGMGEGDARHVAGRAYLIRPRVVTPDQRVELYVDGVSALLPWAPDEAGLYRLRGEDLVDSGFHGFGGRRCEVRLDAAVLEVAVLGHFAHVTDARVCAWLRQSAEEVGTVRRAFPYPRVTVRVIPVPSRDGPALFGMVLWSSPPSISLLVGQEATPESFTSDWVALHELLHLAHPAILPRVSWLSEGLATYYTEVARARSGRQTAEHAWKELLEGFARGQSAAGSRTMEEVVGTQNYSATYWTGALFALHLDVELRRVTGNHRRLDDVLELLASRGQTSTLGAFGAAVDAVAGQPLFEALLARHLPRPAFSELRDLLEDLGVVNGPDGVKFVPARDSLLREAVDGRRSRGDGR